jgi:hypothetical protein
LDVLNAGAREHMSGKRDTVLSSSGMRAKARAKMSVEVKPGNGGLAYSAVSRYCTGSAPGCSAWIESPDLSVGQIRSSDECGAEFGNLYMGKRVQFEFKTSFGRSRTVAVYPEGPELRAHLEINDSSLRKREACMRGDMQFDELLGSSVAILMSLPFTIWGHPGDLLFWVGFLLATLGMVGYVFHGYKRCR